MEHLGFPRPKNTHIHKKNIDTPWTWTHIDSKKENWLPKGDTNVREAIKTKKKRMIVKESSK
jgi:hypothetical protein